MKKRLGGLDADCSHWMEKAAVWRLLSLLFRLPDRETRREIKCLAPGAPAGLAALAREWTGRRLKDARAQYHRALGPGGIPASESWYRAAALAGRGPLLADIAGCHRAFGYRPPQPAAEVPDHIAAELDFASYLAFKVAFAAHRGQEQQKEIAAQAYGSFLQEHLGTWLDAFRRKLRASGFSFFARAAAGCMRRLPAARRGRPDLPKE